mmetsp:Transcript_86553/g.280231  ORF Transcript_86553/g.280231 Transcript_86553/m.280231 type:complete len:264 (+) Transcript_86553:1121-1912(+)
MAGPAPVRMVPAARMLTLQDLLALLRVGGSLGKQLTQGTHGHGMIHLEGARRIVPLVPVETAAAHVDVPAAQQAVLLLPCHLAPPMLRQQPGQNAILLQPLRVAVLAGRGQLQLVRRGVAGRGDRRKVLRGPPLPLVARERGLHGVLHACERRVPLGEMLGRQFLLLPLRQHGLLKLLEVQVGTVPLLEGFLGLKIQHLHELAELLQLYRGVRCLLRATRGLRLLQLLPRRALAAGPRRPGRPGPRGRPRGRTPARGTRPGSA